MRISAVTLPTSCIKGRCFFRRIGLDVHRGGESASFTTFQVGLQHLNLRLVEESESLVDGPLVIFSVDDVDQTYQKFLQQGLQPEFEPRDAQWGERYFHIRDPDGNSLSFAERLDNK